MLVAGVDGTKKGWVAVVLDGLTVSAFGASKIEDVLEELSGADAIAVDVPIGFLDEGQRGGRACEQLARKHLKGRASSVFSSPVRGALSAETWEEARRLNRESSPHSRDLSAQSLALFSKIMEVDAVFSKQPALQDKVFETHPEVAFSVMAKTLGRGSPRPKTWFLGMWERLEMLESEGLTVGEFLKNPRSLGAVDNDILDAAACAWTARRRALGQAFCLPEQPPIDARGLRMEMWI